MNKLLNILWRSLVVGAVYVVAVVLSGELLRLIGLKLPTRNDLQGLLLWMFAGSTIAGLVLGPLAESLPARWSSRLLIWTSVLFFNLASVAIEAHFFAPALVAGAFPGLLLQQLLVSLAAAGAITVLFTSNAAPAPSATTHRSWFSWVWRFLVSALSYLVFYFIFGAANYALVTQPYYQTHTGGLTVPTLQVVLVDELIRAPLVVLSVLPFLLAAHDGRKRVPLQAGLMLFVVGGLLPLSMQATSLPLLLLAASAVEIFFQNFSTGLVAGRLLARPE